MEVQTPITTTTVMQRKVGFSQSDDHVQLKSLGIAFEAFKMSHEEGVETEKPPLNLWTHQLPFPTRRPMIYVNYHHTWFHDPKNWNDNEKLF